MKAYHMPSNPLQNRHFRSLLQRYFGKRRYLLEASRALNISHATVKAWIYEGKPIKPIYYKRLAQLAPLIMRKRERWAARQITFINRWLAAQPVEVESIRLELEALRIRAERHGASARVDIDSEIDP